MWTFEALSAEILKSLCEDGSWNPRKWKKYKHLRLALDALVVPGFNTLEEKIWAVRDGLSSRPICAVCHKHTAVSQVGFRRTCSVKCAANDATTKAKTKTTQIERYGAHHTQNKEWAVKQTRINHEIGTYAKGQQTLKERYGVSSVFALEPVKQKIRKTNLERYGVENPAGVPDVIAKRKGTCVERYGKTTGFPTYFGDENPMTSTAVIFGGRCVKLSQVPWEELQDSCKKDFIYISILGDEHLAKCRLCSKVFNATRRNAKCDCVDTSMEKELFDYVRSLGVNVKRKDRKVLSGLELDILCQDQKFAIELNGVYWHGELTLSKRADAKTYHREKYLRAKENGISLLQVTDVDWKYKTDLVKSMIKSRLGLSKRVYARSCEVKILPVNVAREFCEKNHISGFVSGKHYYGLVHQDELVMLCSIGTNRFTSGIELLRMCTAQGMAVVGGFSKLMKAINTDLKIDQITSYCDLRYGSGEAYIKAGFRLASESGPGYWYIDSDKTKVHSRLKYQKHKLKELLENFDPSLTEWENMKNHSFDRIWDCGQRKFILDFNADH